MTVVLLCPVVLAAQNGITISSFSVAPGTVTFDVSWGDEPLPDVWSDSVWVFVDYNAAGVMKRLPLTGATLTNSSSETATVTVPLPNNKGAWVAGNARSADSFSATCELYYDSQTAVTGACAYASNYPPVGEYISTTKISFTGMPMYNIVLKSVENDTIYRTSGADFDIPENCTLVSFTDKTGAPGIMKCIAPATYTLIASALDFCAGSEGIAFALSGTESGKDYQLYRDNSVVDDAVLNGTGSAETFTGSFDEAGTYTALSIADELYCAIAMSESHVVNENPLPDNPDVTGDSRDCAGTVTLNASSSGAVIDWYADASTTTKLETAVSYTTPEIGTSTTYYVQARVESTGCVSARVPVSAEVITEGCCDAPGATVDFTAFIPCTFPVPAAGSTWSLADTREALSSPSNPQTYTVKLMADGRYWMVQDLKFGNQCGTTFIGSDGRDQTNNVTNISGTYYGGCTTLTNSNTTAARGYLYDWAAAMNHANAYYGGTYGGCTGTVNGYSQTNLHPCQGICPVGWHLPTGDDAGEYVALYRALGGDGKYSTLTAIINRFGNEHTPSFDADSLHWHGAAGERIHANGTFEAYLCGHYYSSSARSSAQAINLANCSDIVYMPHEYYRLAKSIGMQVRCVRNY
jgi:uncharacterized protein (TIGR02145 family)